MVLRAHWPNEEGFLFVFLSVCLFVVYQETLSQDKKATGEKERHWAFYSGPRATHTPQRDQQSLLRSQNCAFYLLAKYLSFEKPWDPIISLWPTDHCSANGLAFSVTMFSMYSLTTWEEEAVGLSRME